MEEICVRISAIWKVAVASPDANRFVNGRPDATDTTARMRKLHTQRSKEKLEQQDREVEELAQGGRKRAAEEDNAEKKQRRRLQRQTV